MYGNDGFSDRNRWFKGRKILKKYFFSYLKHKMLKNDLKGIKFNKFLTFGSMFCECDRLCLRFDKKITKKNLHILKHSVTFTPSNNDSTSRKANT